MTLDPAPVWLPGGQAQTVWPALFSRSHDPAHPIVYRRQRHTTPDADFVDIDWLDAGLPVGASGAAGGSGAGRGLLVLFHGLEGSSRSHYALAFADWARRHGWCYAVPHFRGCSGELNLAPRAYHSGDHVEIGWMLDRVCAAHGGGGPVVAVGVSLGGNALLRWAQESGSQAGRVVQAVASVCSPIDLAAAGHAIGRGLNRYLYTPMFLRTMKPKALAKLAQHPGLFDAEQLRQARDLYTFDNLFTAPLHGYRDTEDYWRRASAKPRLAEIRIPALVINARNDPFVPAQSLPGVHEVGSQVTLWQPDGGGHVGFPAGQPPGDVRGLPRAVMGWMQGRLGSRWPAPAR
ncbi:YheT family hydrolase [Sphaerotilus sp.]|uniref:YheT family hydrolase n=1 Tax=Sphaerotilus sp. TaxID=2093942 RepID=UPI002ACEE37B|nr:alpha/beta fold hydrolase [Sphaerotilus sp.]MDZ7857946.1 alpha/beta fold hydrolase [Sphaerotilus sp.]